VLYVYVFGLTLGAILLAFQLFGHTHDGGDTHTGDHEAGSAISALLSVRFATFVLGFGGAAGLLLTLFGLAGSLVTALAALGVGVTSGLLAQFIVRRAVTSGGGASPPPEIRGRSAAVLVPFGKGTSGLVRIQVEGRTTDLIAETDEDAIESGEEVLILETRGATARVTRSPLSQQLPAPAPPRESKPQ
jgi:membrane protein implicated in regulation of membrane protease activity